MDIEEVVGNVRFRVVGNPIYNDTGVCDGGKGTTPLFERFMGFEHKLMGKLSKTDIKKYLEKNIEVETIQRALEDEVKMLKLMKPGNILRLNSYGCVDMLVGRVMMKTEQMLKDTGCTVVIGEHFKGHFEVLSQNGTSANPWSHRVKKSQLIGNHFLVTKGLRVLMIERKDCPSSEHNKNEKKILKESIITNNVKVGEVLLVRGFKNFRNLNFVFCVRRDGIQSQTASTSFSSTYNDSYNHEQTQENEKAELFLSFHQVQHLLTLFETPNTSHNNLSNNAYNQNHHDYRNYTSFNHLGAYDFSSLLRNYHFPLVVKIYFNPGDVIYKTNPIVVELKGYFKRCYYYFTMENFSTIIKNKSIGLDLESCTDAQSLFSTQTFNTSNKYLDFTLSDVFFKHIHVDKFDDSSDLSNNQSNQSFSENSFYLMPNSEKESESLRKSSLMRSCKSALRGASNVPGSVKSVVFLNDTTWKIGKIEVTYCDENALTTSCTCEDYEERLFGLCEKFENLNNRNTNNDNYNKNNDPWKTRVYENGNVQLEQQGFLDDNYKAHELFLTSAVNDDDSMQRRKTDRLMKDADKIYMMVKNGVFYGDIS